MSSYTHGVKNQILITSTRSIGFYSDPFLSDDLWEERMFASEYKRELTFSLLIQLKYFPPPNKVRFQSSAPVLIEYWYLCQNLCASINLLVPVPIILATTNLYANIFLVKVCYKRCSPWSCPLLSHPSLSSRRPWLRSPCRTNKLKTWSFVILRSRNACHSMSIACSSVSSVARTSMNVASNAPDLSKYYFPIQSSSLNPFTFRALAYSRCRGFN